VLTNSCLGRSLRDLPKNSHFQNLMLWVHKESLEPKDMKHVKIALPEYKYYITRIYKFFYYTFPCIWLVIHFFIEIIFTSTWLLPSYFSIISDGEEAKRLSYFSDNLFSVFPHKLFLNELLFIFITYIKIFLFYLFIFLHHSPFVTETAPAALPFSGDTRKYFF